MPEQLILKIKGGDLDFEKYRMNTLETQYKYIITSRLEKVEHHLSRVKINFKKMLEIL